MIVSRFPYPLDKGDKLRAYHQLKELSKSFEITLVAFSDKTIPDEHQSRISEYCKEAHIYNLNWFTKSLNILHCLINKKPFQTGYFYSFKANNKIKELIKVNTFNHIYCQLIRTAEYIKNEHRIPKTLDYMDALSAGVQRRISQQPFYKKWIFRIEAKRLVKYEQHIFDYFENKLIISEQDKNLIHHPDRDKIVVIPNGIDVSFFEEIERIEEFEFVFVGNMSYPPNIEAVYYIVEKILPHFPEARLLVSGSSPHSSVLSLAEQHSNVEITGWVEDIRTSYAKGKIFLAPMLIGTGMQNKLLEAMAMKIPCITTPLANNAIQAKDKVEILVGKDTQEIVACIKLLLENDEFRVKLAEAGSEFVKENYSWEESVATLKELMELENEASKEN